jgi:hypothetical protein
MMIKLNNLKLMMFLTLVSVILCGCGGKDFKKTPLDNYIVEFSNEKEFSIILQDMDVDGTFFKTYKHKYKVIKHKEEEGEDALYEETTDWVEVSKEFFWKNENNLGMCVLEKSGEGKISKVSSPPGYRYVGDKRYGEWRTNNGGSFWSFYGRYMFMNQMFGMIYRPVYRRDYNTYSSGGYYGRRNYYGPKTGSSTLYGTNSSATRKANPNFFQRRATKSGWSSSRSRSGSSNSRSRGSGYGK